LFVVALASYGYKNFCSNGSASSQPYDLVPVEEPDIESGYPPEETRANISNDWEDNDWEDHSQLQSSASSGVDTRHQPSDYSTSHQPSDHSTEDDIGSLEWAIRESLKEQDSPFHEAEQIERVTKDSVSIKIHETNPRESDKRVKEIEKQAKREEMKRAREQRIQKAKEDKARRKEQKDKDLAAKAPCELPHQAGTKEETNLFDVDELKGIGASNAANNLEETLTSEDLAEMGLPAHLIEKMLSVDSEPKEGEHHDVRVPAPNSPPVESQLKESPCVETGDLLDLDDDDGWGNEDDDDW